MALRLLLGVALILVSVLAKATGVHTFFVTLFYSAGLLVCLTALLWSPETWRQRRWAVPVTAVAAAIATTLFDVRQLARPAQDMLLSELLLRLVGAMLAVVVFGYITFRFFGTSTSHHRPKA